MHFRSQTSYPNHQSNLVFDGKLSAFIPRGPASAEAFSSALQTRCCQHLSAVDSALDYTRLKSCCPFPLRLICLAAGWISIPFDLSSCRCTVRSAWIAFCRAICTAVIRTFPQKSHQRSCVPSLRHKLPSVTCFCWA